MVHINIVCVGKVKETFSRDLINEYTKRLSKYCEIKIVELPDKKLPEKSSKALEQQVIDEESQQIMNFISKSKSYNIALDLTGKQYTSEEFASKLENLQQITSEINFIIGGSLGMNDELKNYCNEKICFSKMTFPHQLIRIFLLEQIFRAFKINNNETYHH